MNSLVYEWAGVDIMPCNVLVNFVNASVINHRALDISYTYSTDPVGCFQLGTYAIGVVVINSTFSNNSIRYGPSLIALHQAITGSKLEVYGSTFSNNYCGDGYGCGINLASSSLAKFSGSRILRNYGLSPDQIGGMFWVLDTATVYFYKTEIANNFANVAGFMIAQSDANVVFVQSEIHHNFAMEIGGILVAKQNSKITLRDSIVSNNSCMGKAGAMYAMHTSIFSISNTTFVSNYARTYGGNNLSLITSITSL